ncbi:MAG: Periplasmic zinc-binding protein TroA [Chlamydiales bacterium]|nr:Periplasmic zinc-binding protein TroA [Chlamydiales bacterium]MCH9620028.1 Periplasmic zinc-binding protein TroA [Chlamydiales bacterium]MCH9622869.1 Periplasmic zinc-binding protein TroA [Chlamydiales bacterium]
MRACICLVLCFLASCSKVDRHQQWWESNGKVKVLSTIAMIDDFVAEIGGEHVDTMSLIRGELDPHSYELVKGDDEKFMYADLIFYNGLGLEHARSLRGNLEGNPKAIAVGDPILKENPSLILKIEGECDPHIWMDITLWMKTIRTIVHSLSAVDPIHTSDYVAAGEKLYTKMEDADRTVYRTMQSIPPERRYLVTSHDAFHYFARRYLALPGEVNWRRRCAAPEGLAPDAQLSVSDIYKIIRHIEKYHVSILFPESNLSRDSLRKILRAGRERGVEIMLAKEPLFGDAIGSAENYLEMISHNVDVISRELTRER